MARTILLSLNVNKYAAERNGISKKYRSAAEEIKKSRCFVLVTCFDGYGAVLYNECSAQSLFPGQEVLK